MLKWSALKVAEALDKTQELVREAEVPLAKARLVIQEARKIPNLPQYISTRLMSIDSELGRVLGSDTRDWKTDKPIHVEGSILKSITGAREDIPKGAVAAERYPLSAGETKSLF